MVKNGANTLTLGGNNVNLTGPVQVNTGTLNTTVNNALGDGAVTVAPGSFLYTGLVSLVQQYAGEPDVAELPVSSRIQ